MSFYQEVRILFDKIVNDCMIINKKRGELCKNYYIYAGGEIVAVYTEGSSDAGMYYFHNDHLGSPWLITNASGNEVQRLSFNAWGRRRDASNWDNYANVPEMKFDRGFTGHEHLDMFGLINMNARLYDPVLGRFLSPDPIVQVSDFTQSYNGYAYAMNNPLSYKDPNGESFILVAAIIGGWIGMGSAMVSSDKSGWGLAGDMFKGLFVGAASGAAGAWAGGAIAGSITSLGFVQGSLSGVAGGFSSGFVGCAGNAWLAGAGFGKGLKAGLIGGGFGAALGGVVGGISGGITAAKHGGDFWSGKGATFDDLAAPISGDEIEIGDGMEYSNEYAQTFSDSNFGENPKGVNKLYADGTLPPNHSRQGDVVLSAAGRQVRGTTMYLGLGKGSNVYLYKAAFISKEQLYFTMGHEYLHAGYFSVGLLNPKRQHTSIYLWEARQAKLWGMNEAFYAKRYNDYKSYYKSMDDYNKLGFFLLNTRPW